MDDIFLFVGQCGSCPRVAYSNDSFQDMRRALMDHFGRYDDAFPFILSFCLSL